MSDLEQGQFEATVSQWIEGLRGGDEDAADALWRRYFQRLVALADARIPRHARRVFDEEDVALSAFHSLCAGVRGGRFPQLGSRDELWSLLAVLTARKAWRRGRNESAQKRGGGAQPMSAEISNLLGDEPTPEFAAQVAEESERLLEALPDDALRDVALQKLEGFTNEEIAQRLGCTVRTVERRLGLIRRLWMEREA